MTYAECLAEFVKVTGHKPGEMNKRFHPAPGSTQATYGARGWADHGTSRVQPGSFSLEPPAQSAGPGRCNRFTRAAALGDPKPCVLDDGHEGPHEL